MKNLTSCFSFLSSTRFLAVVMSLGLFFSLAFIPDLKGESHPVILAFGDSLTAGFGVAEKENYPSYLQVILKQKGYPHRVVNAGVSGDTTAGGVRRISWLLQQKPQIVILALGANDGLRGLPLAETEKNLRGIVEQVKAKYPNVKTLLAKQRTLF